MSKYLDDNGLIYFWSKIKTWVNSVLPTKTSELTNDSGYITSGDIPEGAAASTTSPKMDGTASVGTEMAFARGDHRHPSDTSKQDTISDLATIRSGAGLGATAYQKPSTGIPKNDLASGVQTSLDRADTALQSFTETDPTVPSWAKQDTKPSYTASEVGALPADTDIPSSLADLTADSTHRTVTDTEKSTWNGKQDTISDLATIRTNASNAIPSSQKGAASGVCPLDANSKIDSQYLPSYVDDVIEAYIRSGQTALSSTWLATDSASGTVITPDGGKIYIIMNGNDTYPTNSEFRWGGTQYAQIYDGGSTAITNAEIDDITV